MSKERMSKLQYAILEALADGEDYPYNSLGKFVAAQYCGFDFKSWILKKEPMPQKFAVSFTRATKLLLNKGLIVIERNHYYVDKDMRLRISDKGKAFVKKNFVPKPKGEKGYRWI